MHMYTRKYIYKYMLPPVRPTLTKIKESESNIIRNKETENCVFGIWFKYV